MMAMVPVGLPMNSAGVQPASNFLIGSFFFVVLATAREDSC